MKQRRRVGVLVAGVLCVGGWVLAAQADDPAPASAKTQNAATEAPAAPVAPSVAPHDGEPMKFCPIGGEVYPAEITYCPEHGVELKQKN